MTTQFTPILQLALPVTGELNGTWGDVVNDNITSMVEQAIAGLATINTWTANSHTLTTADGTTDEARCAMLVAATGAGGTALTGAGEIICPARTKLFVMSNASAHAVTLKTAAGTGISVPSGDTAFLFCDGTNVNPCVTTIVNGHISGNLTVDGNTTLGNSTSDTITATARVASDLNPAADNTYDLGTLGNSWRNLYIDGTATIATLNVTTIDTTNLEVTNIKAKDGTASATIADATGVMTIGSSVLTTTDINGGTIDGTVIGGAVPAAGTFTTAAATTGNITTVNSTTVDTTNIEVTNVKAKDGTAGMVIADVTGNVTFSSTGAITVSKGTTAEQPGTPDTGMMRYNETTDEFEGYSGASPSWKSIGGSAIVNDTTTASYEYPLFAAATTGTAQSIYTSNANLLYKPSTGELQAKVLTANTPFVNTYATVEADYTTPANYNTMSVGPVTVNGGITVTVTAGTVWAII